MTTSPRSSGTAGLRLAVPRLRDARGPGGARPHGRRGHARRASRPRRRNRGTGKSSSRTRCRPFTTRTTKKRVVIATANIALQEQLVRGPADARERAAVAVHVRAAEGPQQLRLPRPHGRERGARELRGLYYDDQQRQVDDVLAWAEATKTGDVSELAFIPHAQVWSKFSVGSRGAKGRRLSVPGRLLRRAREGDGAGRGHRRHELPHALRAPRRAPGDGQDLVLPAFDLLVLDEAHEAAEIAREFFGFTLSEHTFGRLASAAADLGNKQLAGELRQEAQRLFAALADFARSPRYKKRLKAPASPTTRPPARPFGKLVALAKARAEDELADKKERATARNVAKNATIAAARLSGGSRSRTRLRLLARHRQQGAPSSGRSPST